MRIALTTTQPTLVEPTIFTAFDVLAPGRDVADVLEALGADGAPCDEPGHVFVSIDAVRRLAGTHADEAWEGQLDGMLSYAGSKGWLSEDEAMIKAHLSQD